MGKTEGTQTLTVIKDGVSAVDAPTLLIFSAITVVALLYSHMHFKKKRHIIIKFKNTWPFVQVFFCCKV